MGLVFQHWYYDLFGAAASVILLFCWYMNNNFDYWKKRGVHHLRPALFYGNMEGMVTQTKNGGEVMQDIYNALSGHLFGGFFESRNPAVMFRDPELIRVLTVRDFADFHHRGIAADTGVDPLVQHLFNISGHPWKVLRTSLTPAFTASRMRAMVSLVRRCAQQLCDAMPTGETELKGTVKKFTVDVIGNCAFGINCNTIGGEGQQFYDIATKIFKTDFWRNLAAVCVLFLPPVAKLLRVKLVPKDIDDFFISVVKDTLRYRRSNSVERSDFFQLLMQIQDKGKIEEESGGGDGEEETKKFQEETRNLDSSQHKNKFELTDELLAAQCFVFFIAGLETSSTLMSYCLHELAVNRDVQSKLQEEICTVISKHDGEVTYESVQEMTYLDKVVNETLRKYPPVPILNRETVREYRIPGTNVVLEKGVRVWVSLFGLHHDSQYFPEPEKFDPERFSEEAKQSRPQYAFLPFGVGPRSCIGMRFALLQSKIGLACLLHKFSFSPCAKTTMPIPLDPTYLTTEAKGGHWVNVSPRERSHEIFLPIK